MYRDLSDQFTIMLESVNVGQYDPLSEINLRNMEPCRIKLARPIANTCFDKINIGDLEKVNIVEIDDTENTITVKTDFILNTNITDVVLDSNRDENDKDEPNVDTLV